MLLILLGMWCESACEGCGCAVPKDALAIPLLHVL